MNVHSSYCPVNLNPQPEQVSKLPEQQNLQIKRNWSQEEDELLLNGIRTGLRWKDIAQNYFNFEERQKRTPESCYRRWAYHWQKFYTLKQIQSIQEKILVTVSEKVTDRRIVNLFDQTIYPSRDLLSPDQTQGVKKSLNKTSLPKTSEQKIKKIQSKKVWSIKEDELLLNGIRAFGTKWTKIVTSYFKSEKYKTCDQQHCSNRWRFWKKVYSIEQVQAIQGRIQVISVTTKGDQVHRIGNLFKTVEQAKFSPIPINRATVSTFSLKPTSLPPPPVSILSTPIDSFFSDASPLEKLPFSSNQINEKKRKFSMITSFSEDSENNKHLKKIQSEHFNSQISPDKTSQEMLSKVQDANEINLLNFQDPFSFLEQPIDIDNDPAFSYIVQEDSYSDDLAENEYDWNHIGWLLTSGEKFSLL